MVSSEFLGGMDALTQLDPVGTYAQRGAAAIARLVGAGRFELELEGERAATSPGHATNGAPTIDAISRGGVMVLPLRLARPARGVLRLYPAGAAARFSPADARLARWAACLYARQLGYVARFAASPARGGADGVHAALARTALSRREREVVALLVAGRPTRDIAARTGLTVATIHTYLKRIYPKLGVHSRVELIARLAGTAQLTRSRGIRPSARRPSDVTPAADVRAETDDSAASDSV
jgi:DNA-binding CsgD family transcriptional regulator